MRSRHPELTAEAAVDLGLRFGAIAEDEKSILLATLKRAGLP